MTRAITKHAPAKINLYLHVTGKRDDGYHLLDSMVVFAPDIADIVTVEPSDAFSFSMAGLFADGIGEDHNNLALRAARLYCDVTGAPSSFSLHLEKNIPSGAGLGGGSADAAATIKALEEFYGIPLPDRDKHLLSLGADVPVCYRARACRFKGIGEVITDIPAPPELHMLLVCPNKHTSTRDVFAARTAAYTDPATIPPSYGTIQQFLFFLRSTNNDLSAPAKTLSPEIAEAEQLLGEQAGCLFTRMSGSGSAVFGLFDNAKNCATAREHILTTQPAWWAQSTNI